jgi:hypothetical protein
MRRVGFSGPVVLAKHKGHERTGKGGNTYAPRFADCWRAHILISLYEPERKCSIQDDSPIKNQNNFKRYSARQPIIRLF